MNLVEVVLVVLLAAAVFFALRHIYRNRKRGCSCCSDGSACSGSCASCGMNRQNKKQ